MPDVRSECPRCCGAGEITIPPRHKESRPCPDCTIYLDLDRVVIGAFKVIAVFAAMALAFLYLNNV